MGYQKVTLVRICGLEDSAQVDVLEAIAAVCSDLSDDLFEASIESLLLLSRKSRPTFYKALTALVAAGYVVVESGQKSSTMSRYGIRIDALPPPRTAVVMGLWNSLKGDKAVKNLTGSSQKLDCLAVKNLTGSSQKFDRKQSKTLPLSSQKFDHKHYINITTKETKHSEEPSSSDSLFEDPQAPPPSPQKLQRKRAPLVTLPETLPDDWRQLAQERRPDIDPDELLKKMRVHYGPLVKKALSTWKRTFLNWLVNERGNRYANNRRSRQQPTEEDWDVIDYGQGTWGI